MVCIRLPHCGTLVLGSAARAQADGGGTTVQEGHCGPPACTTPGTTSPVFPCYLVSKGNPKQFGAVSGGSPMLVSSPALFTSGA